MAPAPPAGAPPAAAADGSSVQGNFTQRLSSIGLSTCIPLQQFYATQPSLSSIMAFAQATNVTGLLAGVTSSQTFRFTSLAPVNSAVDSFLASLDPGTIRSLAASPRAALALLAYHGVLPPVVMLADMTESRVLPTLAMDAQGNHLSLTVRRPPGGGIRLEAVGNSANVLWGDVPVCEGVVHAVDAILLPVRLGGSPQPPGAGSTAGG